MAQLVNNRESRYESSVGSLATRLDRVEDKKSELASLKKDIKQYARDLEAKGRAYDKIRLRADEKPTSRNLNKLSRAEAEFDEARALMRGGVKIARDTVNSITADYTFAADSYSAGGSKSKAKKYSKMAEKFSNKESAEIDKIILTVGEYTLGEIKAEGAPTESAEPTAIPEAKPTVTVAQPQMPPYAPNQFAPQYPPFYFLPTYCDPGAQGQSVTVEVNDELRAVIKEAVAECIAPLFSDLEAKLTAAIYEIKASAPKANEPPTYTEADFEKYFEPISMPAMEFEPEAAPVEAPAIIPEAPACAEVDVAPETVARANAATVEIKTVLESLAALASDAEAIAAKVGEIAEAQRNVIEMQRAFARDMQGVQVKQKLVNTDQTELLEAQEVVLQHQKLIREQHDALFAAEGEAVVAVSDLLAKQGEIESAIKASIQTQKNIIQTNVKNNELQRELIEKQGEIATAQRDAIAAQKQLARAVKLRTKKNTDTVTEKTTPPEEAPTIEEAPATEEVAAVE